MIKKKKYCLQNASLTHARAEHSKSHQSSPTLHLPTVHAFPTAGEYSMPCTMQCKQTQNHTIMTVSRIVFWESRCFREPKGSAQLQMIGGSAWKALDKTRGRGQVPMETAYMPDAMYRDGMEWDGMRVCLCCCSYSCCSCMDRENLSGGEKREGRRA